MRFITDYGTPIATSAAGDGFIGMNTRDGFCGLYGSIADEKRLGRLYIIKGSSGCGKSTMMRRIADAADEAGYNVQSYLCSSDYTSLDAVVIDGRVAVVDGTSPHSLDMRYPGAASELIDLSVFWDCAMLSDARGDIERLSQIKSDGFGRAYGSLGYFGMLCDDIIHDGNGCIDHEKMNGAIDRLVRSFGRPDGIGAREELPVRAIGMRGRVRLPHFEDLASAVYRIEDTYGTAYSFMSAASQALSSVGCSICISPDPICPTCISDIYIPHCRTLLTVEVGESAERKINMDRFIIRDRLAASRGGMRLAHKCSEVILAEAEEHLRSCADAHFEIEKIYGASIDFESLDRYTSEVCDGILAAADSERCRASH